MPRTRRTADPDSPRDLVLRIRVSGVERAVIEERAGIRGESLSAYLVRVGLGPVAWDRGAVMRELFAIRRSLRELDLDEAGPVVDRLNAVLDGVGL